MKMIWRTIKSGTWAARRHRWFAIVPAVGHVTTTSQLCISTSILVFFSPSASFERVFPLKHCSQIKKNSLSLTGKLDLSSLTVHLESISSSRVFFSLFSKPVLFLLSSLYLTGCLLLNCQPELLERQSPDWNWFHSVRKAAGSKCVRERRVWVWVPGCMCVFLTSSTCLDWQPCSQPKM